MLTIIVVLAIFSIFATVLVITASMLSSRLSRVEDRFLGEEIEIDKPEPQATAGEATQSFS